MLGQLKRSVRNRLPHNLKKRLLSKIPILGRGARTFDVLIHPYDREHGTDTSGFTPAERLLADRQKSHGMHAYLGTQPSIVRRLVAQLPDVSDYAFVDIGCGKARPALVAAERPFKRIIGVEMSPALVKIAQRNARLMKQRFPNRTEVEVVMDDAVGFRAAHGRIVYFFYHAFSRELFERFIAGLEAQLGQNVEHAFLIYLNPVHGDIVDRSAHFVRWLADKFAYDRSEFGFGPDQSDSAVIWQSVPARYAARHGAERHIDVLNDMRAELSP